MTAATVDDYLIATTDLACVRGGRLIFAGVAFKLTAGEALVVTGPNGSGKSSLLRLLAGLGSPAQGTITISSRPRYLGHLNGLKPALSVAANLQYAARLTGEAAPLAMRDALGVSALMDFPVRILSQGQQRRVALAQTFSAAHKIWILDEPTTGLDTATIETVRSILRAHRATGGVIIAATHADLGLDKAQQLELHP